MFFIGCNEYFNKNSRRLSTIFAKAKMNKSRSAQYTLLRNVCYIHAMAIGFARINIHTRSQGHSAVRGAAYRSGEKLFDSRTGVSEDFTQRQDVLYTDILLPDGANEKFQDRELLWNEVEACEKRRDSQVAKDCILALPKELELEKQVQLARNFAHYHFVSKGLVADIAIHAPHEGEENYHAHIYITTRRLIGDQFDAKKARDLNPCFANSQGKQGFISEQSFWNKAWRQYQNDYFVEHDIDLMVDEDHIISQRHEGRIASYESHYLKEENALNRQIESKIALCEPEAVLNELSSRYAVFTEREIQSILFKSTDSIETYQTAYAKLKAHPDLVELDINDAGRACYTTKATYTREAELADNAKVLARRQRSPIPLAQVQQISENMGLSHDQQSALYYLSENRHISAIVGRAGTGKSYLMKAANALWTSSRLNVIGLAPSGIAAKGLEMESGISSMTIASFKLKKLKLSQQDIVVLDEAGMVDLYDMAEVMEAVKASQAKLVILGDPDQLQPIGPGAPFRAIIESVGFTELSSIRRQIHEGDRKATHDCAMGDIFSALKHYRQQGSVILANDDATTQLINAWASDITKTTMSERIILAHQRCQIAELNQLAREKLQALGILSVKHTTQFQSSNGVLPISLGERIVFLRNDKQLGVKNGEFATVQSISGDKLNVQVQGRTISLNHNEYNHIDYGYATTVHKAQGLTKDKTFIYVSGCGWNRHLAYVALSRHRDKMQLFASKQEFKSLSTLANSLGREGLKDNSLDWPLRFSQRRGLGIDSIKHWFANTAVSTVKNTWTFLTNYQKYIQQQSELMAQHQQKREEKLAAAVFAHYCDYKDHVCKMVNIIKRNLPKDMAFYEHPEYPLLLDAIAKRNDAANVICSDFDKYADILKKHGIKSAMIHKQAREYICYERVRHFSEAIENNTKDATILATEITKSFKSHYKYLVQHNIDWETLNRHRTQAKDTIAHTPPAQITHQLNCDVEQNTKIQGRHFLVEKLALFEKHLKQYETETHPANRRILRNKLGEIACEIKVVKFGANVHIENEQSLMKVINRYAKSHERNISQSHDRSI